MSESLRPIAVEGNPDSDLTACACPHTHGGCAGIQTEQLAGPADRWCASPSSGIVPCAVDTDGVFSPEVFRVNGDPAVQGWTRLITVYPDDGVEVLVACRNAFTGAIGCPSDIEVTVRTVSDAGDLVGDLEEAQYVDAGASTDAVRAALTAGP